MPVPQLTPIPTAMEVVEVVSVPEGSGALAVAGVTEPRTSTHNRIDMQRRDRRITGISLCYGLWASVLPAWSNRRDRRVCDVCGLCPGPPMVEAPCPCDGLGGSCSSQRARGGGEVARAPLRQMSRVHGGLAQ